jgi:hypothetical protein
VPSIMYSIARGMYLCREKGKIQMRFIEHFFAKKKNHPLKIFLLVEELQHNVSLGLCRTEIDPFLIKWFVAQ